MLPLTIAVSCIHTRSIPSLRVIFAAVIVTTGFLLGVAPRSAESLHWRSSPSALSILYGVLSSLFIAVHAVLIKSSLPHAQNSTIQLAYWQNLGSAIFLAPFILLQGEYGKLQELISTPSWNGTVFAWGSLVTGVFGFLLCVAGLLSIKVTSPITHMFSSVSVLFCLISSAILTDFASSYCSLNVSLALFHDILGCAFSHPDFVGSMDIQRPSHSVRIIFLSLREAYLFPSNLLSPCCCNLSLTPPPVYSSSGIAHSLFS